MKKCVGKAPISYFFFWNIFPYAIKTSRKKKVKKGKIPYPHRVCHNYKSVGTERSEKSSWKSPRLYSFVHACQSQCTATKLSFLDCSTKVYKWIYNRRMIEWPTNKVSLWNFRVSIVRDKTSIQRTLHSDVHYGSKVCAYARFSPKEYHLVRKLGKGRDRRGPFYLSAAPS